VPLGEDDPLRGNEELAHSHHTRLVEEQLATLRVEHPELEQVVLRIGTVLGEQVDNQVTALFERRRLLRIARSDSPFSFVWDTDVVAVIQQAVTGGVTGAFNVAGDGTMTVSEIAKALGTRTLVVPEPVLRTALRIGHRLHLTPYGAEQTRFLRYRPVLDNARLKAVFGYTPGRTSREAFDAWRMRGQTA
jgi:UDP-glucose 4-epimerase